VPWWGAVLIAVGLTAVGFAFDAGSGNKELGTAFAVLYAVGCIAAVLAVRQHSVFTAVVQPPLILFVAVPSAYFLFNHAEINGIKDILINCGYPLIERFLLMFTTSAIVLLIGMARWYFGAAARSKAPVGDATPSKAAVAGLLSTAIGKLSALTQRRTDGAEPASDPRKHAIDRPATARKSAQRPTKRPAQTRSRHARPPLDDRDNPAAPPPRRRRAPSHARDLDAVVEGLAAEPPPRRRPRAPRDPNRRTPPAADYRQEPQWRDPGERPARPSHRPDRYDPTYDMPSPPPRRRPTTGGTNGTHHPVSRVRYRGGDTEPGSEEGGSTERDVRYRSRPRARHDLDDWRYQG
jgi:hypothetical protein